MPQGPARTSPTRIIRMTDRRRYFPASGQGRSRMFCLGDAHPDFESHTDDPGASGGQPEEPREEQETPTSQDAHADNIDGDEEAEARRRFAMSKSELRREIRGRLAMDQIRIFCETHDIDESDSFE